MLCAFEGWNDAGSAATETLYYLERLKSANELVGFDSEEYYNFTESRPLLISQDDGEGEITWPEMKIHQWFDHEQRLRVLSVTGPEPQLKWRTFVTSLLGAAQELQVDHLILLGGLLAEVPHTRAFPLAISSYTPSLRNQQLVSAQTYTGPTGIVGILAHSARQFNITDLSLWVSIPHYAGQPPHPKASLEFLRALESILGIAIPIRPIEDEALAWERGAAELMEEEPELAAYVEQLEQEHKRADAQPVTGDDIAAEFEKFLKRREQ